MNAHEIIDLLEETLHIDFNYNYDLFDQSHINAFSASGSEAHLLNTCFTQLGKDYSMLEEGLYVIKENPLPTDKIVLPHKYSLKLIDEIKTELAYSTLSLEGLDTYYEADLDGVISFEGYFSQDQIISLSYLGFTTKTISLKDLDQDKLNTIVLKEQEHMLDEIVIRDSYLIFGDKDLAGDIIENDVRIGGILDADVLKRSQMVAGVYNSTESLSDLQVRGGVAGQTDLKWNNIQLYQSSLFMGNVSSMNPFMTDVIRVNKNGGSAKDPGNSSGSIHMQSDHYTTSKSKIELFTDLLYFNVGASRRLLDNKVRVKAAYRHSNNQIYKSDYYNILYENVFQYGPVELDRYEEQKFKEQHPDDQDIQNIVTYLPKLSFGDYSASVMIRPSNKLGIDLNYMALFNDFSYEQTWEDSKQGAYGMKLNNDGISGKINYEIAPFWKTELVYSNSIFDKTYEVYNDKIELDADNFRLQENYIHETNVQLNQTFRYKEHEWKLGVSYEDWDVSFIDSSKWEGEISNENSLNRQANEKSIYLDYTVTLAGILKFRNGTRWSDYSLTFDNRIFLEPRIHISLLPLKDLTIHAHYGKYHRTLNKHFQFSELNIENDFWYLSDEAQVVDGYWIWLVDETQYSAGIKYTKSRYSIELEAYNKRVNNIWSQSFDLVNDVNPWTFVNSHVSGLELSINYNYKWFSLTNTYELMRDDLILEDNSDQFKNPYVQPFRVFLNADIQLDRFRLSTSFNFAKGKYFSEPIDIKPIPKVDYIDFDIKYGAALTSQLPDYHRLDISGFYKIIQKDDMTATIGLSIQNVYNRQNSLSARFRTNYRVDPWEVNRFDQKGLPFSPNLSLHIEF